MLLSFFAVTLGLIEIGLKLTTAFLRMLNRLFDSGNVRANGIKTALNFVEFVAEFSVLRTVLINRGVVTDLIGNERFDLKLEL